jgi:hypothetical protein
VSGWPASLLLLLVFFLVFWAGAFGTCKLLSRRSARRAWRDVTRRERDR